jgi:hypothetical protein
MTLEPQNYTWAQFVDAVLGMLTVDASRLGSGFLEVTTVNGLRRLQAGDYRLAMLRQGVIQLQGVMESYRLNHETLYLPSTDLVTEGCASRGVKPPQSVIRDVWLAQIHTDATTGQQSCTRFPTRAWPWEDRFSLVNGKVPVNDGQGVFCIDPQGYTFYVYPEVFDCWMLSIHWDGLKLDFKDAEETPFDEATVGAVAEYVKAKISREVEHDTALHDSYMRTFGMAAQRIYTREREKSQMKKG